MYIRLSREGIFPLVDDTNLSSTGWTFPGTIQGEGKLCGVPSLFVRTQGCNLRCSWKNILGENIPCDTAHTWSDNGGYNADVTEIANTITSQCMRSSIRHVVVTGGEPMLQTEATRELMRALYHNGIHTTIETNGTIFDAEIISCTKLLSISPKLGMTSMSDEEYASVIAANIQELFLNEGSEVQLKFVVSQLSDEDRILSFLSLIREEVEILPEDILIMPMGATSEEMHHSALIAAEIAVKNGWRFTPRLHVDLWNNKERT